MKVGKLREFANFILNGRRTFDMDQPCDCIAGHCLRWLSPRGHVHGRSDPKALMKAFDLTHRQANDVYGGYGHIRSDHTRGTKGRRVAAALLRHLATTGKVDWPRASNAA